MHSHVEEKLLEDNVHDHMGMRPRGLDSSLETWMIFVGHYEFKPPIYQKVIKKNKCIRTNGMLENGLMYLYWAFHFNVINASTTYAKYKSWINFLLLRVESMFIF